MPYFSPEVVGLFVDALADTLGDKRQDPHLISLLSVSPAFRCSAQKHLFKSVVIRTYPLARLPHGASRLLEILSAAPHILQFIRRVHIALPYCFSDAHPHGPGPEWTPCTVHTINPSECPGEDDPNLANLLHLLAATGRVEELELSSNEDFRMTRLSPVVLNALVALRCSPSLWSLTVDFLAEMPQAIIRGIASQDRLQEIVIGRVSWTFDRTALQFQIPVVGPRFAFLEAAYGELASGIPPLSRLETLEITHTQFPYFFPPSQPHAAYEPRHKAIAERMDLGHSSLVFPNLKVLSITRNKPYHLEGEHTMIADLLDHAPVLESFLLITTECTRFFNDITTGTVGKALGRARKLQFIELQDDKCALDNLILSQLSNLFAAMQPFAGPLTHTNFSLGYVDSIGPSPESDSFVSFMTSWTSRWKKLATSLGGIDTLRFVDVTVSFPVDYGNSAYSEDRVAMARLLRESVIKASDCLVFDVFVENYDKLAVDF